MSEVISGIFIQLYQSPYSLVKRGQMSKGQPQSTTEPSVCLVYLSTPFIL